MINSIIPIIRVGSWTVPPRYHSRLPPFDRFSTVRVRDASLSLRSLTFSSVRSNFRFARPSLFRRVFSTFASDACSQRSLFRHVFSTASPLSCLYRCNWFSVNPSCFTVNRYLPFPAADFAIQQELCGSPCCTSVSDLLNQQNCTWGRIVNVVTLPLLCRAWSLLEYCY